VLRGAAAGVIGLALSGVQLLPAAVHIARTARADPTCQGVEATWALLGARLPELVLPGLFAHVVPTFDPVFAAVSGPGGWPAGVDPAPFAASICVGLVPVALAGVGAFRGRDGVALAASALVLAWIAMGTALGAHALLRHVPIWQNFRYMEKVVGPLTLVLAILAAKGADAVASEGAAARRAWILGAGLAVAAALATAWLVDSLEPEAAALLRGRIPRWAWHPVVSWLGLLAWSRVRARVGERTGAWPLVAGVFALGAAASMVPLQPGDPAARLGPPVPALVAEPPGPRVATPYWNPPPFVEPGPRILDDDGRHGAALAVPSYNVGRRLDSVGRYTGMTPRRLLRLEGALGARWDRAARRFAVSHVLLDRPADDAQAARRALAVAGGEQLPAPFPGVEAWAVPHRPWAVFPRALRPVPDEASAFTETIAAIARDDDTVTVLGGEGLAVAPGRVRAVSRGTEWLRVEAESADDATLVVSDAWWPGWEATIDGRPVPILQADTLVRAVPWPAGRHVLEMRYRPPEVRDGLRLSAVALLLVAGWISWALWRAGRPAPRGSPG
jgi:hypothetical protein